MSEDNTHRTFDQQTDESSSWLYDFTTVTYRIKEEVTMQQKTNHQILDEILGPDGRCPVAEPYTGREKDGSDFIRYLETHALPFDERFRKFLPKERRG
jgi:hypothetical protein